MTGVAVMAALLCVLGPLAIPIGPVPFSLAVLVICLTAVLLGAKRAAAAVALYLLIGFAGLPVFTGFAGGPGKMLGPTGGYMIGYVFLALLGGWAADRYPGSAFLQFAGMCAGLAVLYAFGTVWLVHLTKLPLDKALRVAVYPFVPVDAVKAVLAIVFGRALKKRLAVLS
jgi:biotin transport system substrate-specific component